MLKMSEDRLHTLREAITRLDTEAVRDAYRAGQFPRAELVKDLDKRYRWDLLSAALPSSWICALYDEGLTNVHIDSALRSIVPPLRSR